VECCEANADGENQSFELSLAFILETTSFGLVNRKPISLSGPAMLNCEICGASRRLLLTFMRPVLD
jgi:hypothetical protein